MIAIELERIVHQRTDYRVENLNIELVGERVILRGETNSFYIKQLAQEGVREQLPKVRLQNAIVVKPRRDQLATAEAS